MHYVFKYGVVTSKADAVEMPTLWRDSSKAGAARAVHSTCVLSVTEYKPCVKAGESSEKWEPYDAKVSRTVLREGLE